MIKPSNFKPAWWLRNPHLQTMWGKLVRSTPALPLQRERFELPDGDFIDLDWILPAKVTDQTPLVVVLHGLGGSIKSHYAKNIMAAIAQQGWRGVFMHYRGCSGTPNLKPYGYHSGYTDDLAFLVAMLRQRLGALPMAAIGYSLGGNILLKWLGETGQANPLDAAIAISPPFELNKAANRLLLGMSRIYQWYILRGLRDYVDYKFKIVQSPIDLEPLSSIKTFWEFDHHITAPLHGFKSALDYYNKASSRQFLKHITVPTLILHALDDPFMMPDVVPTNDELSPYITLELSKHGGHVGFVSGAIPGKARYWLEQRITHYLQSIFNEEEKIKQVFSLTADADLGFSHV